jgi:cysteinyl-tRNA synthetase
MSLNKFFILSFLLLMASCDSTDKNSEIPNLNFREEMRKFVKEISVYSKNINGGFLIIPQNGQELLTLSGEVNGDPAVDYINAIDGVGREDLFYGYDSDNTATPASISDALTSLCKVALDQSKLVMVTDYCSTTSKVDDSFTKNNALNFVSFAADQRELNDIPAYPTVVYQENADNITSISQVKNFLYLINPTTFSTKQSFIDALKATNYDLLLIDYFFDNTALTAEDLTALKTKANGGQRLVIAYMSIGEAEDYRYYWNDLPKTIVEKENANWPGNYAVRYWEQGWKNIIYGQDQSYTKRIIDAGFNGVYLDIIEAYETFE